MYTFALATFVLVLVVTATMYTVVSLALSRATDPARRQRWQRVQRGVLIHGGIIAVCALAAGFLPLPF